MLPKPPLFNFHWQEYGIVVYFTFPAIDAFALIVSIVKKRHHSDITKYALNITKSSQMRFSYKT